MSPWMTDDGQDHLRKAVKPHLRSLFVGPHVAHGCLCRLSVDAAEDETCGDEGEICDGGVDDALQCHDLLSSRPSLAVTTSAL